MARLVVLDVVLLALVVAYLVWVSRINRGTALTNLFVKWRPAGRERWVGAALNGVVITGLVLGTDRYSWGTRWVNLVAFAAVLAALCGGIQLVHNRALDRR